MEEDEEAKVMFGLQKRICRCCLNCSNSMAYAASVSDYFLELTGIIVSSTDGLPQWICTQCMTLLRKAVRFRAKIQHSDNILRSYLNRCAPFPIEELDPELTKYATPHLSQTQILQFNNDKTKNGYHKVLQHCVGAESAVGGAWGFEVECKAEREPAPRGELLAEPLVKLELLSDFEDDMPLLELRSNKEDSILGDDSTEKLTSKSVKRKKVSKSKKKKKKYHNESEKHDESENHGESDESITDLCLTILEPLESKDPLHCTEEIPDSYETKIKEYLKKRQLNDKTFLRIHRHFITWKHEKNITSFTENVFLAYFNELDLKNKPSTLSVTYSMLKTTMLIQNGVNLDKFEKLKMFLKEKNRDYSAELVKVFTKEDVDRFLKTAPDDQYLTFKVIFIIGIYGCCSPAELLKLTVRDVEIHANLILVKIQGRNKKDRSFILPAHYSKYVKKYINLRPKDLEFDRFIVLYKNGSFVRTPMGITKFRLAPMIVAKFLNLKTPKKYIGRKSFRKTFEAIFDSRKSSAFDVIGEESDSEDDSETNNDTSVKKDNNLENYNYAVANHNDTVANHNDKVNSFSDKLVNCSVRLVRMNYCNSNDDEINSNDNRTNSNDDVNNSNDDEINSNDNRTNSNDDVNNSNDDVINSNDIVANSNNDVAVFNNNMANSNDRVNNSNDRVNNSKNDVNNSNDIVVNSNDGVNNSYDIVANSNGTTSNKTPDELAKVLKSNKLYVKAYNTFTRWMDVKCIDNITEDVMLEYYKHRSKEFRPSSLWNNFSMLRKTILFQHKVDIKKFDRVKQFLRSNIVGYERKTTRVFTADEIDLFLSTAPDYEYLATKVVVAVGVAGACSTAELAALAATQVRARGAALAVRVTDYRNKVRAFRLPPHYAQYVLRNKVRAIPSEVASFLILPNPKEYNGACFKQTSISIFGPDICTILTEKGTHNNSDNLHNDKASFNQWDSFKNDNFDNNEFQIDNFTEPQDVNQETLEVTTSSDNRAYIEGLITKIEENSTKIHENCTKTQENCTEIQENSTKIQENSTKIQENSTKIQENSTKIQENNANIPENSIPEKSHSHYEKAYESLQTWMMENDINTLSDVVLLKYFEKLSNTMKPSSLYPKYSFLKASLKVRDGIDISTYDNVRKYLMNLCRGYRSEMKAFTMEEVDRFLRDASDDYLHWKAALILGISGACQIKELVELTMDKVKIRGKIITVKILSGTKKRKFFVKEKYFDHVKKYIDARTPGFDKFFLAFHKNPSIKLKRVMGKNSLGKIPKGIAKLLKLPNPEDYVGQCFRRTSLKLFGNWSNKS